MNIFGGDPGKMKSQLIEEWAKKTGIPIEQVRLMVEEHERGHATEEHKRFMLKLNLLIDAEINEDLERMGIMPPQQKNGCCPGCGKSMEQAFEEGVECGVCGKVFHDGKELMEHLKTHTEEEK